MVDRRKFIQKCTLASVALGISSKFPLLTKDKEYFSYESMYMKIQLSRSTPAFSMFSTDSLGGGNFSTNPILQMGSAPFSQYMSQVTSNSITYFSKKNMSHLPIWECKMQPKVMTIRTRWGGMVSTPFEIAFAQKINHCTVLGIMQEKNEMNFPCVLHFPGMGTFRVYCNDPKITLNYDADRSVDIPYVKIALPAASEAHKDITYQFDSITIYPFLKGITENKLFDGFRRNFINIFQVNARKGILANNSASDNCAFTLYWYAEMAKKTPELIEGLSAMDLVRNTLGQYISGVKGYGQVGYMNVAGGWQSKYDSSDSAPSLIISACEYILSNNDKNWALKNYPVIRDWAVKMIATDRNDDGIIEYGYSGNSGSWDGIKRPANWWDTIGFGHDDAYSNALAYRAGILLANISQMLDKPEDAQHFASFSSKLKSNYYPTFYNPNTGVLAGWRSSDGQLHDYYFTFVNSVAICYGLIEKDQATLIMNRILSKMKEVGFNNFRLGLPGNLIPVPEKDYTDRSRRFGYGAFQVYENGGATGCYVYFTIQTLYKLGMIKEAERILMSMLESYTENNFQGRCPGSKMSKDWKTWKGECWGYEGFLVDNYLALLAVSNLR